LRTITPSIPVTRDFLVGTGPGEICPGDCDYARWAPEQDIVSNDHYLIGLGTGEDAPRLHPEFRADLSRGLAGGRPWWLMEHSTSAVNWQRVTRAKSPTEMERNSLAHLARGADAICFFQFRQSVIGAREVPLGDAPARRRELLPAARRLPARRADRPAGRGRRRGRRSPVRGAGGLELGVGPPAGRSSE
jgi:beta-galactosidase GanA